MISTLAGLEDATLAIEASLARGVVPRDEFEVPNKQEVVGTVQV